MKVKLLVVTREVAADRRYGLGKSLLPLLEALQDLGVESRYLCREDAGRRGQAGLARLHPALARLLRPMMRGTDVNALLWGVLERLNMGRLAAKVGRQGRYSHIHCHDPLIALGLRLFLPLQRLRQWGYRPRWGLTEHGFGSYTQALHEDGAPLGGRAMRGLRALERGVLRRCAWVVAPTELSLAQLQRDLGLGRRPPHWQVVPHPCPVWDDSDRAALRARLGWAPENEILLGVGRLVPLKDFQTLVRAFAGLNRPGARLVLLGEGDARPLHDLAASLGVSERFEVRVTDDIASYYAGADLYVSVSTTESFGLANLEAVSAGLPAVCTAVGGVPEVVGRAAVMVPAHDPAAVTEAMQHLLSDPEERRRRALLGRQLAREWPSARSIAAAMRALYLGERRGAATLLEARPLSRNQDPDAPSVSGPLCTAPPPVDVSAQACDEKRLPPFTSACSSTAAMVAQRSDEAPGCGRLPGSSTADASDTPNPLPLFSPIQPLEIQPNLRVLVFAPHADDESLGCGATLAALSRLGAEIRLVVVTDGRRGDPEQRAGGDPVLVRRAEVLAAANVLGLAETRFLDLPDGELVADAALAQRLGEHCDALGPDWIFAPSHRDAHRDHVAVGRTLIRVCAQRPGQRLFLYETWTPVEANRILDVSETFALKKEALALYHLPLLYVDYLGAAEGLGRYRAMQLPGGRGYAEAFLEWNRGESRALQTSRDECDLGQRGSDRKDGAHPGGSDQPGSDQPGSDQVAAHRGASHHTPLRAGPAADVGQHARWWVTKTTQGDFVTFDALFQESFGQAMHESVWRWKYAPGRGQGLFVWSASGAVAHYGGLTRAVHCFGDPVLALQPVDVLVRPRERGVLTRKGPMFLAAATLFDAEVGLQATHRLIYGFPTKRHMALGHRLGLFVPSERIAELVWSAQDAASPGDERLIGLNDLDPVAFEAMVMPCWQAMAADYADKIIAVRDAHWLRYRYLEHPERRYRILAVVDGRQDRPVGVLVLRTEGERCELLDLVGATSAMPRLVDVARRIAAHEGAAMLYAWITEPFIADLAGAAAMSPATLTHAQRLAPALTVARSGDPVPGKQALGVQTRMLDIYNGICTRVPVFPPEQVMGRWWLMSGDSDFR